MNVQQPIESPVPEDYTSYLEALRAGMVENRITRQERRDAGRRERKYKKPNPQEWEAVYQDLLAACASEIRIAYWRCSNEIQTGEDRYGPDLQQRNISAWYMARASFDMEGASPGPDLTVFDVETGSSESRVGTEFLRRIVKEQKARITIVAYRFDRLSRDVAYGETMNKEFKKYNVQFFSASENVPKGPLGDLMRLMLLGLAQYELSIITGRLQEGRKTARQTKGVYTGVAAPYVYINKGTKENPGKGLIILVEAEAKVVLLIFQLREIGYRPTTIADYLNRMKIPPRQGKAWTNRTVNGIIQYEAAYRAEALFSPDTNFESIAHEPILPYRDNPECRIYIKDLPLLPIGRRIPDDPFNEEPILAPRNPFLWQQMTPYQASEMLLLFRLVDRGLTHQAIARHLNSLGLPSLSGRPWYRREICEFVKKRELIEKEIARLGVTNVFIPLSTQTILPDQDRQSELLAIERIQELRAAGMGLGKIVSTINAEGHKTINGNRWHLSTVGRILHGEKRRTEMSRSTRA